MRVIGENVTNELIIENKAGGGEILVNYRFPTTDERIEYGTAQVRREKDMVRVSFIEARQEYGSKIITGIRKGDLKYKVDGELKDLSSDPKDPDFDPEWKTLIRKYAPDLLEALCIHAFGIPDVIAVQSLKDGKYNSKN
jgi:hypothetical protein